MGIISGRWVAERGGREGREGGKRRRGRRRINPKKEGVGVGNTTTRLAEDNGLCKYMINIIYFQFINYDGVSSSFFVNKLAYVKTRPLQNQ